MPFEEFSFKKFSDNAFYRAVNAHLVDMAGVGSGQRIVDLACGTGSVTRLIAERIREARDSVVIGVDHSSVALKAAMDDIKGVGSSAVQFVQSQVEQFSGAMKDKVDMVFFCNAIHYFPDKKALLADISRALRPGGKFAFNTSFYEGSHPPETLDFYRKWMFKANRILKREYGLTPVKAEKVEARRHLTPEEYKGLLEQNGYKIVESKVETIHVPLQGWLDISAFEDFITGVFPGVPLDKASAALKAGVIQTFDEMKVKYIPRNWLSVVAMRA